jgi:23S rRNA (pseudouridine1915-N3)-methyltransferase
VRVFVYFVGKRRSAEAHRMAEDYVQRASRYLPCEMREIKPGRFDLWERHPSASRILLDPAGRAVDSAGFTELVRRAELASKELIFVLGGAEGLPPEWRDRADLLLSLSPLTLPHELARVVLAEQIYRAVTTLRGHPYPR